MEFLSAFLDSHWMEHVRRSATVFILQPRGPACIPARTEHAPLVASTRDHNDSHHAPPEPCRYVRAARPRLASLPIPRGGDRDRRPAPSIAFGNPIARDLRLRPRDAAARVATPFCLRGIV